MSDGMVLRGREQRMVQDLIIALGASLDLHAVLKDAFRLLLPLVDADYGALATPRSERADEYEWIVQDLPPAFLGSYEEMAPHDFVRSSVLSKINVVVRDSEMIDRRALEQNMMYHRAREVGSPLEHVMAVMLRAGSGFQSGLSLYRDRRRPFTEREQRILQQLTTPIANAVHNCRFFAKVERRSTLLEMLLGSGRDAIVVVRPPAQEIDRTASATALLDAWFTPVERGAGGLPRALLDGLAAARAARAPGQVGAWTKVRERDAADLEVAFFPVPEPVGEPSWALRLRVVSRASPAAVRWQSRLTQANLTKKEQDVVSGMLAGWDNALIAQELDCKLNTVKKHATRIFDKLGVGDRKKLAALYQKIGDA